LKKGRKAFEKSVSLQPSNAIYRSNLAFTLLMAREMNKAMGAANEATKLNPKIPGPYQVRASIYLSKHELAKAEHEVDICIQLDPQNPQAYVLKSDILITMLSDRFMHGRAVRDEIDLLKRAEAALKTGEEKCKARCDEIKHEQEAVSAFTAYFSKPTNPPLVPPNGTPPPPEPGVTPLKVISTPPAHYTDNARAENVQGSIRVVILLGSTGKVEQIMFLSKLGHGLDQEVLKAARQIKFEPKRVDGKPVASVIVREYTFSIY
jgi:TonB family protein